VQHSQRAYVIQQPIYGLTRAQLHIQPPPIYLSIKCL